MTGRNQLLKALERRVRAGQALPTQVNLELTHDCNLTCRHCYLEHREAEDELSASEWFQVLDQAAAAGAYFIAFTGGEILCRPDLFEIVEHARKIGLFYHFQTNGTMIDARTADRFRDLNPTKVEMSVYGGSAKTHDLVTGVDGSFARTVRAMELLRSRDIRVQIKTTVLSVNWREVPRIRELALDAGAGFQPDPMVMPGVFGSSRPSSFRMSDADFLHYLEMEGWHRAPTGELAEAFGKSIDPSRRLTCSAARSRMAISPVGEVYPCVLWRVFCGNIRQDGLEEIWNGSSMSKIRNVDIGDLPECRICDISHICIRCSALAFMETGNDLSRAPESCRLSRLLNELKS